MSNVAISVHILRNHFRGGQGDDYLDYAESKDDYVICGQKMIM